MRAAPVAMPPVGTRTAAPAAPAAVRLSVDPRAARVLVQALCLVAVIGAPSASLSRLQGLVLAQALAAVAVFLVLRTTRTPGRATLGTLRVWGVGALFTLVALTVLREALPHDLLSAELCVVGALVALVVLGRMRDAYGAAGTQLDAILATLPPARVNADPAF